MSLVETQNDASTPSSADQKHRAELTAARSAAETSWDKTILWLSAGALGVSLTFVKTCIDHGHVRALWVLAMGWLALVASLFVVLASFQLSLLAWSRAINQVDANDYGNPGGCWSRFTVALNLLAGVLCLLGVLFVMAFALVNLSGLHG